MSRAKWKLWAICALQIWPLCAAADGFSLQQSVQVGRPLRAAQITLREGESLVADVGGTRVTLPARGVRSATVEAVRVAADASVTIVRMTADNGEWVALLGGLSGKELLVAERADLHGDPGERRALVVGVDQSAGDLSTLTIGTRYDGLALCGSPQPLLLNRRAVDPKTLKLSAPRPGLPVVPGGPAHANATIQPTPSSTRLSLLRAASSTVIDPLTATPQVPAASVDARRDTSWPLPPSALATFRWSAQGLAIDRFELEFTGRKTAATLTFYFEGGAFDVSLPKPGAGPDRFSVAPPAPVVSACLSVANDASGPLQLAELSALTRIDGEGGLERLVSDLVQDGPASAVAGELLATLGEPAARALATRFDELSPRGRRRALKALAAGLALPEVEARVLQAARDKDESLQQAAINTLAHGGEPGLKALRALALEASASGDAAVRALAAPGRQELGALLAALAAPGGVDRSVLRRALIALGRRNGAPFDQAAQAFADQKPSPEARAALALIAAAAERPKVGLELAEGALEVADFPSRFRLCLAAGQLAPSAKLDAWLAQKATDAEEWMLRREAYEALRARSSDQAQALAGKIAHDKYPRVRASATPVLAQARAKANLVELAHKDPWPLVRVAAIQSLAGVAESRGVLAQSLEDSSRNVRAAAIDGLVQQKASDVWPEVAKRLAKEDEWPVVKAAALRFAGALCIQGARDALTEIARRGLRHDASDEDRSLSLEALRSLHDLGGDAAGDARLIAERESGSAELKRVMEKAGSSRCEAKTAAIAR